MATITNEYDVLFDKFDWLYDGQNNVMKLILDWIRGKLRIWTQFGSEFKRRSGETFQKPWAFFNFEPGTLFNDFYVLSNPNHIFWRHTYSGFKQNIPQTKVPFLICGHDGTFSNM